MIRYLATRDHLYTIRTYLNSTGRILAGRVVPVAYEDLFARMTREFWLTRAKRTYWKLRARSGTPFRRETLAAAGTLLRAAYGFARAGRPGADTYIFSDLERLSPEATERAAVLWESLAKRGDAVRLLNHPIRAMRRYELLRTLYERGLNSFNVYRLTEARWPQRYPVFLRREGDHNGPISPLLRDREELEAAVARLDREGRSREGVMITEFCDTADVHGIYRKLTAFVVGDRMFPKGIQFSRRWMQKFRDVTDDVLLREEREYLDSNPHEDEIREIFRIAGLDYGRMDYGLLDGKVQVWEINTNPMIESLISMNDPAHMASLGRQMAAALERTAAD